MRSHQGKKQMVRASPFSAVSSSSVAVSSHAHRHVASSCSRKSETVASSLSVHKSLPASRHFPTPSPRSTMRRRTHRIMPCTELMSERYALPAPVSSMTAATAAASCSGLGSSSAGAASSAVAGAGGASSSQAGAASASASAMVWCLALLACYGCARLPSTTRVVHPIHALSIGKWRLALPSPLYVTISENGR